MTKRFRAIDVRTCAPKIRQALVAAVMQVSTQQQCDVYQATMQCALDLEREANREMEVSK